MRILIGVTGSIAAYKTAILVRGLVKKGHEVKVILTPDAETFVTPLTLSTLSKNPVNSELVSDTEWANHVELGLWADLMLIAPATANTLAKMAHGLCNNMLMATYLSAKCPVWFAPAMDLDMWKHPATQKNIQTLLSFPQHHLIPVGSGELASGLSGPGRMAEPEEIIALIEKEDQQDQDLLGLKALVTAGPTREAIDPVRFISNRSSGTMGARLAEQLAERGAQVTLVMGAASIALPDHQNISIHSVESAEEMYQSCKEVYNEMNLVIFSAAVADYRPAQEHQTKMKKSDDDLSIPLVRTTDIAWSLSQNKGEQIHVGFALETNNEEDHALRKLEKKKFDFIVLNSLAEKGAGFGTSTNKITIYDSLQRKKEFDLKSKTEVAKDIVDYYVKHYKA